MLTNRELLNLLLVMTDEQLDDNVTVFEPNSCEFFAVEKAWFNNGDTNVLHDGSLVLQMDE